MTTPAVITRRPRLPAASRRRQLLDVALETFAGSGLEATTMDDIAREAGVTKPLLYQHFKSKRALFLELLDDVVVRIIEAIRLAAQSAAGPRQQVEAVCEAYFGFMTHNEFAIRLLLDSTLPYDEELAEAMRRVDDTIANALRPLIQADIGAAHQRVLAAAVVGMAKGVSRDWLRTRAESKGADSAGSRDAEAELLARRVSEFAWAGLRHIHRD